MIFPNFRIVFSLILFFAQVQISKCQFTYYTRPIEYERPTGELLLKHNVNSGKMAFTVLSDRSYNMAYPGAEVSGEGIKINYLDKFVVINEKNDFFQVVKYNNKLIGENGKLINPSVVGWIEKSKLLLWQKPIMKDGFAIKALALIKDSRVLLSPEDYINKAGIVRCYNFPSQEKKYEIPESGVNIFKFLFVLKEENGMVLLCTSSQFTTISAETRILGWVPKNIILSWENRLCIEPNFNPEAIKEREQQKFVPSIFLTSEDALAHKNDFRVVNENQIRLKDGLTERMPAYKKRMPIFEVNATDKIVRTGYITPVIDSTGTFAGDGQKVYNDAQVDLAKYRRINLVFLMDGGEDMRPYLGDIKNAINSFRKGMDAEMKQEFDIRFGAVIYKNYKDDTCSSTGDASVSKFFLTKDYEKLNNFIDGQSLNISCSPINSTRALKKGIYSALKVFEAGKCNDESNYIIAIGSKGDRFEDYSDQPFSDKELQRLFAKHAVNMFSFQYNRALTPEYSNYNMQFRELVEKGNTLQIKNFNENKDKLMGDITKNFIWEEDDSKSNYNSFKIKQDQNTIKLAEIKFPASGSSISNELFLIDMADFLNHLAVYQISNIHGIQNNLKNLDLNTGLSSAMKVILRNLKIDNINDKVKSIFEGGKYQYFVECYTPLKVDGMKYSIYERVLFFTREELDFLLQAFEKCQLSELDTYENKREALYDAFETIALSYLGYKQAKGILKSLTGEEFMKRLTGSSPRNMVFSRLNSLEEIKSKKFSEEDVDAFITAIIKSSKQLSEIKNKPEFSYIDDGEIYYWIPETKLP